MGCGSSTLGGAQGTRNARNAEAIPPRQHPGINQPVIHQPQQVPKPNTDAYREQSSRKTEIISKVFDTVEPLGGYGDGFAKVGHSSDDEENLSLTGCALGRRKEHVHFRMCTSLQIDFDGGEEVPFGLLCQRLFHCSDRLHGGQLSALEVDVVKRHLNLPNEVSENFNVSSKAIRKLVSEAISCGKPDFSFFFQEHQGHECPICAAYGMPLPANVPYVPTTLIQRPEIHSSLVQAILESPNVLVFGNHGTGKAVAVARVLQEVPVRALSGFSVWLRAGMRSTLSLVQELASLMQPPGPHFNSLAAYKNYFQTLPLLPTLNAQQENFIKALPLHRPESRDNSSRPPAQRLYTPKRVCVLHKFIHANHYHQLREVLGEQFSIVMLTSNAVSAADLQTSDSSNNVERVLIKDMTDEEGLSVIEANTLMKPHYSGKALFLKFFRVCNHSIAAVTTLTSMVDSEGEMSKMVNLMQRYCSDGTSLTTALETGFAMMPLHWLVPYLDLSIFPAGAEIPRSLLLLLWRRRFPEIGWDRPNRLPEIIHMLHGYLARGFLATHTGFASFTLHDMLREWMQNRVLQTVQDPKSKNGAITLLLDTNNSHRHRLLLTSYQKAFKGTEWSRVLDGPTTSHNKHHHYMREYVGYHVICGELLESIEDECVARHTMWYACRMGKQEVVRCLTSKCGGLFHALTDYRGHNALLIASSHGRSSVVAFLLQQNAHINYTTRAGETCLTLAVKAGHTACVELLLKNHADAWSGGVHQHQSLLDVLEAEVSTRQNKEGACMEIFFRCLEILGNHRATFIGAALLAYICKHIGPFPAPSEASIADRANLNIAPTDLVDGLFSFQDAWKIWKELVRTQQAATRLTQQAADKAKNAGRSGSSEQAEDGGSSAIEALCETAITTVLSRSVLEVAAAGGRVAVLDTILSQLASRHQKAAPTPTAEAAAAFATAVVDAAVSAVEEETLARNPAAEGAAANGGAAGAGTPKASGAADPNGTVTPKANKPAQKLCVDLDILKLELHEIEKIHCAVVEAAKFGQKDVLLRLIQCKANVASKNRSGETSLQAAVRCGHLNIVNCLLHELGLSAEAELSPQQMQELMQLTNPTGGLVPRTRTPLPDIH